MSQTLNKRLVKSVLRLVAVISVGCALGPNLGCSIYWEDNQDMHM